MLVGYGVSALTVVGLALIVVGWKLVRALAAVEELSGRVTRFGDAVALLTEASEAGFRSTAHEMRRIADAQDHRRDLGDLQRRLSSAAARGESVQQIAAEEHVSEGEVRLRLSVAEATTEIPQPMEKQSGTLQSWQL